MAWLLLVVGLIVAGYAAAFGVVSWEVTLALIIVGALVALIGGWMVIRGRRTA
jgi:hypothetical protein